MCDFMIASHFERDGGGGGGQLFMPECFSPNIGTSKILRRGGGGGEGRSGAAATLLPVPPPPRTPLDIS